MRTPPHLPPIFFIRCAPPPRSIIRLEAPPRSMRLPAPSRFMRLPTPTRFVRFAAATSAPIATVEAMFGHVPLASATIDTSRSRRSSPAFPPKASPVCPSKLSQLRLAFAEPKRAAVKGSKEFTDDEKIGRSIELTVELPAEREPRPSISATVPAMKPHPKPAREKARRRRASTATERTATGRFSANAKHWSITQFIVGRITESNAELNVELIAEANCRGEVVAVEETGRSIELIVELTGDAEVGSCRGK
mmetsp:Transcript_71138/g.118229  ORF Transcript_71138/g.118229 Transcript_71138/m.118229 type:complete len:250 (-) Transcript_71138:199-948(-)